MADFSKIPKKVNSRKNLGEPPSIEAAPNNLEQPEHAPLLEQQPEPKTKAQVDPKIDGRSLRATGYTKPFATRTKPEVHQQYKMIAARDGITMGELLEQAINAYEKINKKK